MTTVRLADFSNVDKTMPERRLLTIDGTAPLPPGVVIAIDTYEMEVWEIPIDGATPGEQR